MAGWLYMTLLLMILGITVDSVVLWSRLRDRTDEASRRLLRGQRIDTAFAGAYLTVVGLWFKQNDVAFKDRYSVAALAVSVLVFGWLLSRAGRRRRMMVERLAWGRDGSDPR